jgi:anthranilate/para-aminobenzoate synthase component II
MIVLIDNYDSFTFNLVHYLGELGADVAVHRNDKVSAREVVDADPDAITSPAEILSLRCTTTSAPNPPR